MSTESRRTNFVSSSFALAETPDRSGLPSSLLRALAEGLSSSLGPRMSFVSLSGGGSPAAGGGGASALGSATSSLLRQHENQLEDFFFGPRSNFDCNCCGGGFGTSGEAAVFCSVFTGGASLRGEGAVGGLPPSVGPTPANAAPLVLCCAAEARISLPFSALKL